MASQCKNCDSVLSYNFVLDIGLCNPCIGKLIGKLEDENKRLREALEKSLPDPLQIELGDGKVLVAKFQDEDGAAGVMFARGHGQFPIGTPFGNLAGKHRPQKGEVYIRCTNLASLEILKQCILEAEQILKGEPK